jgi:tungstate transport system substrate-binding protein
MKKILLIRLIYICILLPLFSNLSLSGEKNEGELIIQSTTSTRDSGFYKFILPEFEKLYKIKVKVVAYGTGQAIVNAKNCNADILIVHSLDDEIDFVKKGYGVAREDLMYNDFVVIGPKDDPFNIAKEKNINEAFKNISSGNIRFISRGDDSGTHKAEIKIWEAAEIDPKNNNYNFYYESGQGMGSTINIAIGMNGYTYTDRATWLNFKNKLNHKILFENDFLLFNQYGIIRVNKKRCPNVNNTQAKIFYNWILSDRGRTLIKSYKVNNEQLFFVR